MVLVFGIDVGTSSTKAVVVDEHGTVLRSASREHEVTRPHPGHVEMDAAIWWTEFDALATQLTSDLPEPISAVGVSGMGPCVLLTGDDGDPLRPAILYGVDARATREIAELTETYGEEAILESGGSVLTTQAVGPKLAWVRRHEPGVWAQTRRLFMPASWLAYRLTGVYALDFHSASQCSPLFDTRALEWRTDWADEIAPGLELPPLRWPGDAAGTTTTAIAGIPAGVPVTVGTIDAWSEAVSVGAVHPGDLMLMYGTTMFLIATVDDLIRTPSMWSTVGAYPQTRNIAGGLATSGSITAWIRSLTGDVPYPELLADADRSGAGARGLLVLPYFAGERTPILDPDARGLIAGLTLEHDRGDIYRAVLEATAFAVRHNIDTMREAGADIRRVVAVGGGTQGSLWTQVVSDVIGLPQVISQTTIGASYGAALFAANLLGPHSIDEWNPPIATVIPDPGTAALYDERYRLYRELYLGTRDVVHSLSAADRAERSA